MIEQWYIGPDSFLTFKARKRERYNEASATHYDENENVRASQRQAVNRRRSERAFTYPFAVTGGLLRLAIYIGPLRLALQIDDLIPSRRHILPA
jgi:hypothetical protein